MWDAAKLATMEATPDQLAEAARIAAELARVSLALPGSVVARRSRCGTLGCACRGDPARLHGPYWSWTRKVRGKTVTRSLSPEQAADYRSLLEASRRLRGLVAQLEALTLGVVADDPRWQRQR